MRSRPQALPRAGLRARPEEDENAIIAYRMRALVQRVSRAAVRIEDRLIAEIGPGMLVLLGVARTDDEDVADRLAAKVRALRVFADGAGQMNEPLGERELLCVSQFTLYADTRRGNRPSFVEAAPAARAEPLYERFCAQAGALRGAFGAHMEIELVGDGPVTVPLELERKPRDPPWTGI